MVWITMSVAPHAGNKKRKKSESKPHSQVNKCLNEKRRREQENIHIEELAELVSASPSDMSSLSCKPDKCAILKETVNQIRTQKTSTDNELCEELQQSEVSSSKPTIIDNHVFGAILLEALDGFLFIVNCDGKVEFVSDNISNFLKFREDEVFEKNIYDFVHPNDRSLFHSNLLLMMPLGNGRDWSADNNCKTSKQAKHFTCRFLVKQEEPGIKMENKEPQQSQYENLNITANYMPLDNGTEEPRNGMTCIARRAAFEEKRVGVNKVEQFTTRVNRDGKVVGIDAGSLCASSKKFLTEELNGAAILDFCHPNDSTTLKQHLKDTFERETPACVPYKFRIGPERYAKIKTKSKRFLVSSEDDYVISTHSIIRDNDSNPEGQKSIGSPPSVASTSSGPGSVSDSSTSLNGSNVLSPLTLSNSYGTYSNSLSATNNIEMINELNLDLFPDSNWNIEPSSAQSKESECTSVNSFVSSPQTAPLSNRSETSVAASPINSTFVSGIASSRGGSSSVPSPAVQNRAPTPYGGSCYSPSAAQQSTSVRSSPPRALPAKSDSLNSSSTDSSGINSMSQGMRVDRPFDMKSNEKLRNLLTQSTDDIRSRQSVSRQSSQDDVTVLIDSRALDGDSARINRLNPQQSIPRNTNVILRDLLNQEEDSEVPVEPIYKCAESAVPNPLLNAGSCKTTENSAQRRMGSNDMLRKLLNTDDSDKNYRKSQDIIHQLLISNSGGKISLQGDRLRQGSASNSIVTENTVPKSVSIASRQGIPDVTFVTETNAMKRKSAEKPTYPSTVKKPNHAHLAGQNPMLAEMLAKTPVTTEVQTSKANSLITQLPQEKLPKHLEKKLIHTPYTAGSISATTSSLVFTTSVPTVQRDIVTSDARAHILQHNPQLNIQTALRTVYSSQQQQQLFDKLVSGAEVDLILSKTLTSDLMDVGASTSVQNTATNYTQLLSQFNTSTANNNNQMIASTSDVSANASLSSLLSDLSAQASLTDSLQASQAVDNSFENAMLETIYSLQEDHNLSTPHKAINTATILKILSENTEFSDLNTVHLPVSVNSSNASSSSSSSNTMDINEKIAISAIQKELMEAGSAAIASKANNIQTAAGMIPTYSQAGRSLTQVSRTSVQAQLTSEQILLLQQQQLVTGSLPPNYNLVANRVRLPVTTQANVSMSPEMLAQRRNMVHNVTVGNVANMNQLRRTMKQKMYLQQQQKRLLEQQKQQRTIPTQQPLEVASSGGTSSFPENINDLLNNTVAPNVTLMRSSGIPEAARFSLNSASSQPSPTSQASPTSAQLSPGQRVNQASPFSPLSQQPFPSQTPPPSATYQAARLSPLPPPSYPQGGPSHSPSPNTPTGSSPHMVLSPQSPQWAQRLVTSPVQNLQLQNPMLNAQLSQASIGANQIRLTAQQRQQLALRSMPSPTSVQNSRGAVFSSQSEANVSPLSPVMLLQSQAPQQQRIQRTRMASGSQNQTSFSTNEPLLSPQSLPSPSFSQSVSTTPTSSFVSISSTSVPISYSATQGQQFTFDRQNIQAFASSSNDSLRSPGVNNDQGTSDSLPQELRSLVNSPNLVLSSNNNQQLLQSLSSNAVTRVLNLQSLTRADLEELGLSVELLPSGSTEAQSASQALFAQALLNNASSLEASVQPASPRVQVEEPKPADQKKSLLQQLLSEPT